MYSILFRFLPYWSCQDSLVDPFNRDKFIKDIVCIIKCPQLRHGFFLQLGHMKWFRFGFSQILGLNTFLLQKQKIYEIRNME